MKTVHIPASRQYDVRIERGLLQRAGAQLRGVTKASAILIVSDDAVWPLFGETVQRSLEAEGFRVCTFIFPHGESSKSAATYLQLLDALVSSARYRGALLQGLAAQTDTETQFSALTLRLAPQLLCLVFRGTDDTLVGWKEDFNMSFRCPVPAQELAAAYLWDAAAQHTGTLLLCGHSKGGNLAVYAAANCAPAIQSRILAVYNYDGPGFPESVLRQAGYQAICDRVQTFVPQSSVIGMLLGHEERYTVVHSARMGIYQHDLYSWDVENGHFVSLESVNQRSRFIDTTLKAWLASLTPAERERFINAVFYLLAQTNAGTLSELSDKWFTNSKTVLRAAKSLDEPTHRAVTLALRQLLRSTSTGLSQIVSLSRSANESEKSLKRGTDNP